MARRERAVHCMLHGSGGLVKSNVDGGALLRKIVLSFEEDIAKFGRIKLLGKSVIIYHIMF